MLALQTSERLLNTYIKDTFVDNGATDVEFNLFDDGDGERNGVGLFQACNIFEKQGDHFYGVVSIDRAYLTSPCSCYHQVCVKCLSHSLCSLSVLSYSQTEFDKTLPLDGGICIS